MKSRGAQVPTPALRAAGVFACKNTDGTSAVSYAGRRPAVPCFLILIFFCMGSLLHATTWNFPAFEHAGDAVQASIHYRAGDREQAKESLRRILEINPADAYANQFMGTLFLMDGNLEACLKYWNRLRKPFIENIRMDPVPAVDPEIMDRAFAMSPASALRYEDYLATESRFRGTGIFTRQKFELKPHKEAGKFDLVVKPSVRKSAFSSKIKIGTLLAQGVFSETIHPEFPNIGGTTTSSASFISWNEYKNRFYSSLSLPYGKNPHRRIRIFSDVRKETWSLPRTQDLNLFKWEGGLELRESVNGRWSWNSGAKISHRSFDNAFPEGWLVQTFAKFDHSLIRIPEERFFVKSKLNMEAGKFLTESSLFFIAENSIEMQWFPHPVGEDLAITGRFRIGKMFGSGPFDEFFELGVERDTDLKLRAHKSSIDKKGQNPVVPAYALLNWEISRTLIEKTGFRARLIPFVDVGKIFNPDIWKGDDWFLDTGIQLGFQVFGATELFLTYGKDLRTGRNVIYLNLASWHFGD